MSLGNRGHIGIKKEVTWGTRVVTANDCFLPFVTEGLTRDIEDVVSAIQRGILDEPRSYQGEKAFGGPLVVEVHPVSIGHILRSALGAPAAAVAADSVETVFCDCETVWEHDEGVLTSLDNTDKKKGTYSSVIKTTLSVAPGDIIASRIISFNFAAPATTHYKFWLKCNVALAAGDLQFAVSETALGAIGAEGYDVVDIPAMAVAGQWYEHTIAIGEISDLEAAISCAILMDVEKGEIEVKIDDVRAVVAGTADVAKKHVFTPMQTLAQEFGGGSKYTPLFPYTFEVFRDEGQAYEFLGCVVNTMALSFSITDKILKANLGIIAKNAGYVDKTGLSLEATNPFVWENAKIYLDEPAAEITEADRYNDLESFTFNWDNKCVAKYSLNNTAIPRKIIRTGYRETPISFTVDFTDKTEYDKFLAGTERKMRILFQGAVVGADAANTPYTLQIDIPLLRYLAWPINIGGPGRLSVGVTGKAKYDAAGYSALFTLINDKDTAEYQE